MTDHLVADSDRPVPWGWLALLTMLALALRLPGLNSGLWIDEILTLVRSVRLPLGQMVTTFPSDNQHTLYSVLAHASIAVLGEHAWTLRLPAVVFGAATVPMLYFFARQVTGRVEALLSALLLAVSYPHIWYSQSARGYSALAFFAVLTSWLLLRGLRSGRTADFTGYGVAGALGVYAHMTMVFLLVSHALLWFPPFSLAGAGVTRRAPWRAVALGFGVALGLTLLLYGPVFAAIGPGFVAQQMRKGDASPLWAVTALAQGLRVGAGGLAAALVGSAMVLAGLVSYFRQNRLVVGSFVLPAVMIVATSVGLERSVRPRFLFYLAGFGVMVVVRGAFEAGRLVDRWRGAASAGAPIAGVALVGAMSLASAVALIPNYRYPKQDFDAGRRFVESHRIDGEPIVTVGSASFVYLTYMQLPWQRMRSVGELDALRQQGRRVWVVRTLDHEFGVDQPEVLRLLQRECGTEAAFRGTLGDGTVTVCTLPPVSGQGS